MLLLAFPGTKFLVKKQIFLVKIDMIHRCLADRLKSRDNVNCSRCNLFHLANSSYSNYKLTRATLKKHRILKDMKNNNGIV